MRISWERWVMGVVRHAASPSTTHRIPDISAIFEHPTGAILRKVRVAISSFIVYDAGNLWILRTARF